MRRPSTDADLGLERPPMDGNSRFVQDDATLNMASTAIHDSLAEREATGNCSREPDEDESVLQSLEIESATSEASATTSATKSIPSALALLSACDPDRVEVPQDVFYEVISDRAARPSSRWGHCSVDYKDRIFTFGGIGHETSSTYIFHTGSSVWTRLPASKHGPGAIFKAAACSTKDRIFVFGGMQNQRYSRKLYMLDPDQLKWTCFKETVNTPPPCASHTMTDVGKRGIFVFGGEGRRLSNSVHVLDPQTCTFARLKTSGVAPSARQSHTLVWDGRDSLVLYGGHTGESLHSSIHTLDLRSDTWSRRACSGTIPPKRHSHSAVIISPGLMLIWGGCGDRGAVLNDAHVLDLACYRWHKLNCVGDLPLGRYAHTCNTIGSRVLIYGGTDASRAFDSMLCLSTQKGQKLSELALHLSGLANGTSAESVKLQLGNHLRYRHSLDANQVAVRRAEVLEGLLKQERVKACNLAAENKRLSLLLTERDSKLQTFEAQMKAELSATKQELENEQNYAAETQRKLKEALQTSSRLKQNAIAVDSYKAMSDRLIAERGRFLDEIRQLQHRLERT